jgi:hypothetical protein
MAAVKIADHYGDDALIYVKNDQLYVDVDRVWPDCKNRGDRVWPDCKNRGAICEGAGEYRTVAIIGSFRGKIEWRDPLKQGHDDA